jgi:hypothetical protein
MGSTQISDELLISYREGFRKAIKAYECFEKLYLKITGTAKEYLEFHSREYKSRATRIQQIILPSIKRKCPYCKHLCCKPYNPELSIMFIPIGLLNFSNYLLIRCNTVLPQPKYDNLENNLCAFWENGCLLPLDCRSYACFHWFCNELQKEININLFSKDLDTLKVIVDNLSINNCLSL